MNHVAADALLLRIIEETCDDAKRRAGSHLVCHAGCFSCCFGPFPITQLDAWRLRRGLEEMRDADPAGSEALVERARAMEKILIECFPGNAATGEIDPAEDWIPREYGERHNLAPCPALDPGTGTCQVYDHRPVACRTFGPPSVINGQKMPHCPLCFQGVPSGQVEACRVTFDDCGAGDEAVRRLEQIHAPRGRTLVAFALSGMRYRF